MVHSLPLLLFKQVAKTLNRESMSIVRLLDDFKRQFLRMRNFVEVIKIISQPKKIPGNSPPEFDTVGILSKIMVCESGEFTKEIPNESLAAAPALIFKKSWAANCTRK